MTLRSPWIACLVIVAVACGPAAQDGVTQDGVTRDGTVDLSPSSWPDGEYERYLNEVQGTTRTRAGLAVGKNGAVTVAYNGLAARAGLEALKQGGSAADAALTTALTQVALTAGAPISYFGILSLVYYDAETGEVTTLNAEWNTVRGETDPATIPGRISFVSEEALMGTEPSGRTALVGGFLRGVEAVHARFGRLPFEALFQPAIHIAEDGMPVTERLAHQIEIRQEDLSRRPQTRAVFTKKDGTFYQEGDVFRQPALAETLRAIARQGVDYMYRGPWAERLVAAVQADGGFMTLEDLASYEVIWGEPLVAGFGDYEVYTNPWPNAGGVAMIEALNMALAADLPGRGHWSESGSVLRDAVNISMANNLRLFPAALIGQMFPGIDFSVESRLTKEHAAELWSRMAAGALPVRWAPQVPRHSDDVVAIDARGNIAAITHTINCVLWGKTAIFVDGISIGDPASFQQAQIAQTEPGGRLPSPTETGILFKDGVPVLGFASMGAGLHQRTLLGLLNFTHYGMTVDEAVDAPDVFLPHFSMDGTTRVAVPAGRFPAEVLAEMGYAYDEVDLEDVRFGGEGIWVAISRGPQTGELRAASHNRNNSDAVAY